MSSVRYTSLANYDLEQAVTYLATERSAETAHRFIERITQRCQLLADMPGMGRRREELAADLRSFVEINYVIFYRPIADGIEVLRVLHGSRDIERVFREMQGHVPSFEVSTDE